ncbi:MAG: class A sortase [Streptococcaceae bacterium]|nr:class A sortase [Streptococcaceae bacterium]
MKKRLLILGSLLVLAAAVIVGFRTFQPSTTPKVRMSSSSSSSSRVASSSSSSTAPVHAYATDMAAAIKAQPLPVLGGIAVPSVNVNLPIFADAYTDEDISMGAAKVKTGIVMGKGNYSLASHEIIAGAIDGWEKLLFTPLHQLKMGAMIYVTDEKTIYSYKVYKIFETTPDDISVLDVVPGKKIVTLITCLGTGETREIVQGELVSADKFSDAPESAQKALLKPYNQLSWEAWPWK